MKYKNEEYDFGGWATRFDVLCADGRTIKEEAFKHQNGMTVPIVFMHDHTNPENVIGHAVLEYRPKKGMYTYGKFNESNRGLAAKESVRHQDLDSLSIYAINIQQDSNKNVSHGNIKEVSLVLAGANPLAKIDYVLAHSEAGEENVAAIIFSPIKQLDVDEIQHEEKENESMENEKTVEHADNEKVAGEGKTLQEIWDTLNEEQKNMVYALIGEVTKDQEESLKQSEEDEENNNNDEEENSMKHNVFEGTKDDTTVLSHDEITAIFEEAKRNGSLKDTVLAHGITDIGVLYPEVKTLPDQPKMIARDQEWVGDFMNATRKSPFSRIKSLAYNITGPEARAKGYVKGHQKIEEVITALHRPTDPTTVCKLQKLDRDDIIDITDFNVVATIKDEMQIMLKEEIARAALVGDGRDVDAEDKINETHIRPIWTDSDTYNIKVALEFGATDTDTDKLKAFIRGVLKARKNYKGAGRPTLYTTEDMLTDLLLMEDNMGRVIYEDEAKLARALRVSKIVTVPVMEGLSRTKDGYNYELQGIVVNPVDYTFGSNRGGAITMFDNFDLNFNKYQYLIEARTSGALTTPYSAITVEVKTPVSAGE